jgi:hypothetical protein
VARQGAAWRGRPNIRLVGSPAGGTPLDARQQAVLISAVNNRRPDGDPLARAA